MFSSVHYYLLIAPILSSPLNTTNIWHLSSLDFEHIQSQLRIILSKCK